jgi:FAD/FMN-containing dehydrogenase
MLRAVKLDFARGDNSPSVKTIVVGGGALWQDVNAALAGTGWVVVGGACPTVGVVGFLLGGGVGFLTRSKGLGSDQLVWAEVVTAEGRTVRAGPAGSPHVDPAAGPDLYWAIRGGGHAAGIGVITRVKLRLHRSEPEYFYGSHCYRVKTVAEAEALLSPVLVTETGNRKLYAAPTMKRRVRYDPGGGAAVGRSAAGNAAQGVGSVCWILLYDGPVDEAVAVAKPILTEIAKQLGSIGQSVVAAKVLRGLPWIRHETYQSIHEENNVTKGSIIWKSAFLKPFSKAVVSSLARAFFDNPWDHPTAGAVAPVGAILQFVLEHVGGAVTSPISANTAAESSFSHRGASRLININAIAGIGNTVFQPKGAPVFAADAALSWWCRGVVAALAPIVLDGNAAYANYADPDYVGHGWEAAYYGSSFPRLQTIKSAFDPENRFRGALRASPVKPAAESAALVRLVEGDPPQWMAAATKSCPSMVLEVFTHPKRRRKVSAGVRWLAGSLLAWRTVAVCFELRPVFGFGMAWRVRTCGWQQETTSNCGVTLAGFYRVT